MSSTTRCRGSTPPARPTSSARLSRPRRCACSWTWRSRRTTPAYFGTAKPIERAAVQDAMNRISQWNQQLTSRALDRLGAIPGLTIYGPREAAAPHIAGRVQHRGPRPGQPGGRPEPGRGGVTRGLPLRDTRASRTRAVPARELPPELLPLQHPGRGRPGRGRGGRHRRSPRAQGTVVPLLVLPAAGGRLPRYRSRHDRHDCSGCRCRAEEAPAGARPARHDLLPHLRHGGGRHHRRDRRRRRPDVHLAGGAVRHLLHPLGADQRRTRRRASPRRAAPTSGSAGRSAATPAR